MIFQKYVVSQIEIVSGQNLTGNYVFFTPWSEKPCRGILITYLVCFYSLLNLNFL